MGGDDDITIRRSHNHQRDNCSKLLLFPALQETGVIYQDLYFYGALDENRNASF